MKISGLPWSATVLFSLIVINMTASDESEFTIQLQQGHGNNIVLFTTNTFIKNQMLRVSGNPSITIKYIMKDSSKASEYVPLKYKGMWIGSQL